MKGRWLCGLAAAVVTASLLTVGAPGVQARPRGRDNTTTGLGAASASADERNRDARNDARRLGRYSGRSRYSGSHYRNSGNNGYWSQSSRYSGDRYRRHRYHNDRSRTAGYRSRYDRTDYPAGWSRGRKRGWRGHSVPPGHWRNE
jgi:hypothetical protein